MNTPAEPISRISWESASRRTEANRMSLAGIKGIPGDTLMTFWAVDWFNAVEQFRRTEAAQLCQPGVFEQMLPFHRAILAEIIAQGETLVLGINKDGLMPDAHFKVEDIIATIDTLRETFRQVHGPRNHPATNEKILSILEAA